MAKGKHTPEIPVAAAPPPQEAAAPPAEAPAVPLSGSLVETMARTIYVALVTRPDAEQFGKPSLAQKAFALAEAFEGVAAQRRLDALQPQER